MNEHEIERIAAAMHQLRPDWPASSLRTLIAKKLGDRPRRDVAVALAWIACEPATSTPARVLETGPWWKAAGVEGAAQKLEPYNRRVHCDVCGKTADRHGDLAGHPFETRHDADRRRAEATPKPPLPRTDRTPADRPGGDPA